MGTREKLAVQCGDPKRNESLSLSEARNIPVLRRDQDCHWGALVLTSPLYPYSSAFLKGSV